MNDPNEPLNLTASLKLTQFIRMVSNKTVCHKTQYYCKQRKLLKFQRHRQLKNFTMVSKQDNFTDSRPNWLQRQLIKGNISMLLVAQ